MDMINLSAAFFNLEKESELYHLAEELCQNHNEKRIITDISISKIPYVAYPDLDVQQCLVVHELAEYLLTLAKSANNSDEIAITCNIDENKTILDGLPKVLGNSGICFGTKNETDIFSDTNSMSIINRATSVAIVSLHNHPSCGTFSVQDISIFLFQSTVKLMIVIGNNGELYYMSKDSEKFNYRKAIDYLKEASRIISPDIYQQKFISYREMRDIADLFLKNCGFFGIEYRHVLGTNRKLEDMKEQFIQEEIEDDTR